MVKKLFSYYVFLVLFMLFITMMGTGAIVIYHHDGGKKYQLLQKVVMTISSVPNTVRWMLRIKTFNVNKLQPINEHVDKKRFQRFVPNKRNALLVSSRYDHSLNTSVVDIIDIDDFSVLHTYRHNVKEMNAQITNIDEFPRLKIDQGPERFRYFNPLLLEDGSLLSFNYNAPMFKIDFCSNIKWINDTRKFHHSLTKDHDGNIWVGSKLKPKSKDVSKYSLDDYEDDAVTKVDQNGNLLFTKGVNELLIQNNILPDNFSYTAYRYGTKNPIHLNDIEPALNDSRYWKVGDLFLSLRNLNAIVHYRPGSNKVMEYITGPFAGQHDVDIISDKEISIFNNNNFNLSLYSEVLIYNLETKKFSKLLNDELQRSNFKTYSNGESHILNDGSLMVEESVRGRIILFDKKGQKEWEYVNKDKNNDIGLFTFSRIIEDERLIENFKSLVENKNCTS